MPFVQYEINFKNFEEQNVNIFIQDQDGPVDAVTTLLGSDEPTLAPCVMESVNQDDDKTSSIKPKRLRIGFNSDEDNDVRTFSDGADDKFLVGIITGGTGAPFAGNIGLDDNQEAFQPRPNPVQLIATDGLNSLANIELKTWSGDVPVGHYSIIEFISMCLSNLVPGNQVRVVMNLYELDTDPVTSHAFIDTFLDSLTFEKDSNTREDCLTVLTKILDWAGCFLTYDSDGWYIIRWDEYDGIAGITTMRAAVFDTDTGDFQTYETIDFNKVIAADYDPLYEGYRLSQDNALRRFQRKAKSVRHFYNYETPKEIPCNSDFLRGTLSATQPGDPLKRNYDYECWTMRKDLPPTTNNGTSYIRVVKDADGYETDRYVLFEVQPSSTNDYYIESEPIFVSQGDKINISCDIKHNTQVETAATGFSYIVMIVKFYGADGTHYRLDGGTLVRDGGNWDVFDVDFNVGPNGNIERIFQGTDDDTVYDNVTLQGVDSSNPFPQDGYITILLVQGYKSNTVETHISNLKLEYIPLINNSYHKLIGQETKIEDATSTSRKNIEKQLFISDSPKRLFKGAMKKFDGSNYVLTETWNYYLDGSVLPNQRMSLFILFQWWIQFKKTRTVIESDFQGINSDQQFGIPGMIYRWKINHEDETNKYWMLTSLRDLNFRTCGWAGVLVEMSDNDGDRSYLDDFTFKYIQ